MLLRDFYDVDNAEKGAAAKYDQYLANERISMTKHARQNEILNRLSCPKRTAVAGKIQQAVKSADLRGQGKLGCATGPKKWGPEWILP